MWAWLNELKSRVSLYGYFSNAVKVDDQREQPLGGDV